jgi:NAD(P)H dehydrogenase (quinone)
MHAGGKHNEGVPIVDRATFHEADGFLFGTPTRFGMMSAQMKAFFDSTGQQWQKGLLHSKPAGVFFATGTQNGGQETTALTTYTQFVHHGMIPVPAGYLHPALQFDNSVAHGGSPYGPGTLAGPTGASLPTEAELAFAEAYGEHFGKIANALKAAKTAST